MNADKHASVMVLLANDAMEATEQQSAPASLLLIDAAITILVTRIQDFAGRRELAEMLAEYVVRQVESVEEATRLAAVVLTNGVAGDGPDRETVWLVDVRLPNGEDANQPDYGGVYDDEERAENEALALSESLGLRLIDERSNCRDPQSDRGGTA